MSVENVILDRIFSYVKNIKILIGLLKIIIINNSLRSTKIDSTIILFDKRKNML